MSCWLHIIHSLISLMSAAFVQISVVRYHISYHRLSMQSKESSRNIRHQCLFENSFCSCLLPYCYSCKLVGLTRIRSSFVNWPILSLYSDLQFERFKKWRRRRADRCIIKHNKLWHMWRQVVSSIVRIRKVPNRLSRRHFLGHSVHSRGPCGA